MAKKIDEAPTWRLSAFFENSARSWSVSAWQAVHEKRERKRKKKVLEINAIASPRGREHSRVERTHEAVFGIVCARLSLKIKPGGCQVLQALPQ
jgi:hypothetical protein